ncbi:hypothetical protein MCEZE4_01959 [Burkholderiaceae bacterium]
MKNKYIALLMTVSLSLLSACGGGSSTTASTTPATDYSAIWQAIIDHPDQVYAGSGQTGSSSREG